jgi:hypothetical protein
LSTFWKRGIQPEETEVAEFRGGEEGQDDHRHAAERGHAEPGTEA